MMDEDNGATPLQVVHEVARHRVVEMNSINTEDVVLMLRVDHIIGVGTSLDAGIDKELRVLPDDRGVNGKPP